MEQHKPLSYESLKTVIQYMDSHFRLVRSRQIASLLKIQKVVPLRLRFLELNDSKLTFDNVVYWYDYCREFIEREGGPVQTLHLQYDLNNDGDEETFQHLMPGDIVIKERDWRGGFSYRDINFINDSYVTCRVSTGLNNPYQTRQSHYGIKLRDMMQKKLYEVLGGKRIHQVEHLKIGVYHGVLRLPEGLKLKIRKLSIVRNNMAVIDAILLILDVSSFPLESLSIILGNPQDPVIHSEIMRTSESLNIYIGGHLDDRWKNLLINLPNKKIYLENEIPSNNIIFLVRNWMDNPRVIGTRLSMQSKSVEKCLNEIEKEFKAIRVVLHERECTSFSSCITLPMTSTSELNIYGAKSQNHEEELKKRMTQLHIGARQIKTGMGKPCMIVMEVMTIGTAKPLKHQ